MRTPEQRAARAAELSGLIQTHGSVYKAARAIGISWQTFYGRLAAVGIHATGHHHLTDEERAWRARKLLRKIRRNGNVLRLGAKQGRKACSHLYRQCRAYGLRHLAGTGWIVG